ncbi:MAG TPA: hypothetical protein PK289_11380, partial [Bacteroidia bacterium]|nr:hypothetical protein [Bacteroidia bacterium]
MKTIKQLNNREAALKKELSQIEKDREILKNKDKITSKVKSFEDACKVLKIKPTLPVVGSLPKKHQAAIVANYKLVIITEALNEGWIPNWDNSNEMKYYPYFDMTKASGFSYFDFSNWNAGTDAASRLCFKNSELAKFA